jgi:Protein of unknown function (DUF2796)
MSISNSMRAVVSLNLLLATPIALAAEAHVHGLGELSVALTDGQLKVELFAPGESIVGFEHEARSAQQRQQIDSARNALAAARWIDVSAGACALALGEAHVHQGEHAHDSHAGEHAHDAHEGEHAHDAHEGEHHDHSEHSEHAHGGHGDDAAKSAEAQHSTWHVTLNFKCGNPKALEKDGAITLRLFAQYPNFERIALQAVTDAAQIAKEIDAKNPKFGLTP